MPRTPSSSLETATTTVADVARWANAVHHLHARIAPHFARPQPRRRALAYLQGLLSPIERKNSWRLAEHARELHPYGMQRLLVGSVWNVNFVRNELCQYVLEHLSDPHAVLAIDETSFPKRGTKSAGVQVQYCGTTGHVQNCQVGVFISYVTENARTLIDRELYLPLSWTRDRPRCQEADIPDIVLFQTKCELAVQMLKQLVHADVPFAWVVADSVYGSNQDLRAWLEGHQRSYVLAVNNDEPVGIQTPDGQRRQIVVRDLPALALSEASWHRLSMSEGTKGPRLFDWAVISCLHQWEADGRHWVLFRRSLTDRQDMTYYRVFAPPETTMLQMVRAIGRRWPIEESFATAKDLGLDHYQVQSYVGWYRHITLVMVAHAFLSVVCAQELRLAPSADSVVQAPLTIPEVRHLLGYLIWPPARNASVVLAWSTFRRRHRYFASVCHIQRRLQENSS